jgi:hypothetical protein
MAESEEDGDPDDSFGLLTVSTWSGEWDHASGYSGGSPLLSSHLMILMLTVDSDSDF